MKKLILAIALVLACSLALTACAVQHYTVDASWMELYNAENLAEIANRYIISVEILPDERIEQLEFYYTGGNSLFTFNRLRVLEVFYGNTQPGEIIEVAQEGGTRGNITVENRDFVQFTAGDELVLFLGGADPEEDSDPRYVRSHSFLVNPRQGIYRVPPASLGGQDIAAQSDDTVLESLHPDNNLVLTVGDLARIAAASE